MTVAGTKLMEQSGFHGFSPVQQSQLGSELYQDQYGVHMDPRTAYQCLSMMSRKYQHFKSVQGLVDAMRDYQ